MADNKKTKIEQLERELESLKSEISQEEDKKKRVHRKPTVLYEWSSPARVFKRWEREKLFTVYLWLLVIIVILLFIKEYLTILVIFGLGFVIYAMVTFPPDTINHKITDVNVEWFQKDYDYEDLTDFWFSQRGEQIVLNIDTKYSLPARLVYLVDEKQKKDIYKILSEYLEYKEFKKKQNFFSQIIDGKYIKM